MEEIEDALEERVEEDRARLWVPHKAEVVLQRRFFFRVCTPMSCDRYSGGCYTGKVVERGVVGDSISKIIEQR